MNRFAQLLDRLAYEPGRNNKLRLITSYLRETPDPDRGYALAALTGALSFRHAKAGLIRELIAARTDPVLFALSYDYVGDLSETVALMWPAEKRATNSPPPPTLTDVVATFNTLDKTEIPAQLSQWLDDLDEIGRWALLKLVTGGLRIGVSARLAKTAAASLGDKDVLDVELIWPGLAPPYLDLFAWLEGHADKPINVDPAPFTPVMLAHAIDDSDFENLAPQDFTAEWKWDGIRVQAVTGRDEEKAIVTRLYSRTGEDITKSFPDLVPSLRKVGAIDGELLVLNKGRVQIFNVLQQRLNRKSVTPKLLKGLSDPSAGLRFAKRRRERPTNAYLRRTSDEAGGIHKRPERSAYRSVDTGPIQKLARIGNGACRPRQRPVQERMRMPSKALCSSAATRPICRGGPKDNGGSGSAIRTSSMLCLCMRNAATASVRLIIPIILFGVWTNADGGDHQLVPVGKAYFGFTDEELKEIDKFVRRHTIEKFGPVRHVVHEPDKGLVFEVAFEGLARSARHKSGVAMRFRALAVYDGTNLRAKPTVWRHLNECW